MQKALDAIAAELRLDAAGLSVVTAEGELHRSCKGTMDASTVLPIASASKWLAVATILTLVDEGKIDLDLPVARYVKEFDRDDKRRITLRQCLANTSGLPPRLAERMRGWDMAKFASETADAGLRELQGMSFRYGGVGFQVAAVAAERVTGTSWHALFASRLAAPLGLQHTSFGTLLPVAGEPGTAALPWVAGGAVSSLADYTRFLRMLAGKGSLDGKRVLSEASVQQMFRDQVEPNVEVHAVGFTAGKLRYGLGTWIEALPSGGVRVMDPGAFGFTPWLDLDLGVGGVFAVRDRAARVLENPRPLQDEVRKAFASPVVQGTASEHELAFGGRDRRYLLHVPPKTTGAADERRPLLLVLHGGGGHAEQVRETTGLAELGVRAGYVVVFADGSGVMPKRLLTWNSGGIPVYASEKNIDDVGFLKAVVADVAGKVAIDPARVYAVGHSNGGMMCHRLAREAAFGPLERQVAAAHEHHQEHRRDDHHDRHQRVDHGEREGHEEHRDEDEQPDPAVDLGDAAEYSVQHGSERIRRNPRLDAPFGEFRPAGSPPEASSEQGWLLSTATPWAVHWLPATTIGGSARRPRILEGTP